MNTPTISSSRARSSALFADSETMLEIAGDYVRDMHAGANSRGFSIDRNQLLISTAEFLQRIWPVSDRTAQIIAGKAIGRYEAWGSGVAFELSHCTDHVVFLSDSRTGRLHAITAVELAQLLATHGGQLA